MTAKNFLTWYKKASKKYAERFLAKWQKEAEKAGGIPEELVRRFSDLYPRGKMLRGALSVLGYQAAGGKDLQEMLKASMAMELMETSILIADDVFDRDKIRRGLPTIHEQWKRLATRHLPQATSQHYGESMAHLTSIVGFHLIPLALAETSFSREVKEKALNFYCFSLIQTSFGEAMDISSFLFPARSNSAYAGLDLAGLAAKIHQLKTVEYSAILPLTFGALLAGKKKGKWLENLQKYAQCLGRVFQIQDDIIGSFGNPAKTGKSNTSDISDGRWTVLVEVLWEKANAKDKQVLGKIFEKSKRGVGEIKAVKGLMVKYGVVGLARERAQGYLEEGLGMVPKVTGDKKYRETLESLLKFVISRTR